MTFRFFMFCMLVGAVLGGSLHEGLRYATHPVKESYRLFASDSRDPVYRKIETQYGDRAMGYTYSPNQYNYNTVQTKYYK